MSNATTATEEYYWDEETQMYYCWDETTQAFYPWEDTTLPSPAQMQSSSGAAVEGTAETTNSATGDEQAECKPSVNASEAVTAEPPVSASQQDPSEVPPPSYQRGHKRGMTRHITLAEHGGFEGVLQVIKDERQQRVASTYLNEEDIKVQQQKERVRDLLVERGLGDEQLIRKAAEEKPLTTQEQGRRSSMATVARTVMALTPHKEHDLSGTDAGFRNVARDQPMLRRSSARFGTSEFSDPTFQSKIEQMLGSTLKK